MKRIAISLVIVFLTCQVSYAVCPYEQVMQKMENQQELTQEDVDEILDELIDFIETEDIGANTIGCDLAVWVIVVGIRNLPRPNPPDGEIGLAELVMAVGILLALIFC
jgi:hypothetical protein